MAGQISEHMMGRKGSGQAKSFYDFAAAIVAAQRQLSSKEADVGVRHQHSQDAGNSMTYQARQPASVGSHATLGKKTMGRLRRAVANQVWTRDLPM